MLIAAYFGYFLLNYSNDDLTLCTAESVVVNDDISLSGYFIRDEHVIPYSGSGIPVLEVENGKRVAKNGVIAKVYSDETAVENQVKIKKLQNKIEALNGAIDGVNFGTNSLTDIESQISKTFMEISDNTAYGNTSKVYSLTQELNILLCQKNAILASDEELKQVNNLLSKEIAAEKRMTKSSYQSITADYSGYFVKTVDGLETTLTPDIIDSLSVEFLNSLDNYNYTAYDASAVGKQITAFQWHYASVVDLADVADLKVGSEVKLQFPFAMDIAVNSTVSKIIKEEDKAVLVLESDYISDQLLYLRNQTATLIKAQKSGLKVDSRAIRVVDGVTGVYAIRGTIAKFIPIEIVYITDNYYLVKWNETDKNSLMVSETVIVGGKDIYDGKQIRK